MSSLKSAPPPLASPEICVRALRIEGLVQGVGFRPFVHGLASNCRLSGWVKNIDGHVEILLQGPVKALDLFETRLPIEAPSFARIDEIINFETALDQDPDYLLRNQPFKIIDDDRSSGGTIKRVPGDRRLCPSCLGELFETNNRRYLYPFINCTQCGPRYSVIETLPYSRHHTSWKQFQCCSTCQSEFEGDEAHGSKLRFQAEGISCHDCGPNYRLLARTNGNQQNGEFEMLVTDNPIAVAAERIRQGEIVAVKGVGGFHLIADAGNREAIAKLRQRKHRAAKAFALMSLNTESLRHCVSDFDETARRIDDADAPILLCEFKPEKLPETLRETSELIAPRLSQLGWMTAYAPVHFLLFYHLLGKPAGSDWVRQRIDQFLVVTSANDSGQPLCADYDSGTQTLSGLCDLVLDHNLNIVRPCDDSVFQQLESNAQDPVSNASYPAIRLGRGQSPKFIILGQQGPPVLALGAYLKNTFCLINKDYAQISAHIGSLSNPDGCDLLRHTVEQMNHLFRFKPAAIACDLHPDFFSTRLAEELSERHRLPLIRVQHHRAHVAAVCAEHQLFKPVLGLVLDGYGYGDDGSAWGGELFYGARDSYKRVASFKSIELAGGDLASREIWRLGFAALASIDFELAIQHYRDMPEVDAKYCEQLLHLGLGNASAKKAAPFPNTSSAGRWFDAIASIIGLRQHVRYEGQAAMELEAQVWLAGGSLPRVQGLIDIDPTGDLNPYPLLPHLIQQSSIPRASALFHSELIDALRRWVLVASKEYDCTTIVCAGGCFQNRLLRSELERQLDKAGLQTFFANQVPCNDAGIALGQAWITRARITDNRVSDIPNGVQNLCV